MNKYGHIRLSNMEPVNFCGKPVFYSFEVDGFIFPYEIKPTSGKHDFNTCEKCQENLKKLTQDFKEWHNGTGHIKPFPLCCANHTKLIKDKDFKRAEFDRAPELAAKKMIFTNQHIRNNYNEENWYKSITDYIDWAVESFGQMPKGCGGALYLNSYFDYVADILRGNKGIPVSKRNKILEYLSSYKIPKSTKENDLKIIVSTYEQWIKEFPFELNDYFGNLQEHYKKEIPLFNGVQEVNLFTGMPKSQLHTKSSLFELLINLTNELLTKTNGETLLDKGVITDAEMIQLELIRQERKQKIKQGYKSDSLYAEYGYRKMIKEWLKDEQDFWRKITPVFHKAQKSSKDGDGKIEKLSVKQIAVIHVYESNQITRENAAGIAAKHGFTSKNSGEGLFQDYTYYTNPANRKEKPTPCTPSKLKNKIALLESVIKSLSPKALQRANDEIKMLKAVYEREYD